MLGLGHDPARLAPAVQGAPREVGEAAHRAALGQALGFSESALVGDRADQALVARETEDVVHAVRLAPCHQFVAGKARIGAQQDLDPRPPGADLADDAFDSSRAPADASIFDRRSLAASRCRPQNTYSGR
jgi:hypothetical protein